MKYYIESRWNGISIYDKMKKGNWNDHIWRRNCPVQHTIEREGEG